MGNQVKAEPEALVSQQEVARFLNVSPRQLHRLLRERDDEGRAQVPLPSHMVGSSRKFFLSEVRAWLKRPGSEEQHR